MEREASMVGRTCRTHSLSAKDFDQPKQVSVSSCVVGRKKKEGPTDCLGLIGLLIASRAKVGSGFGSMADSVRVVNQQAASVHFRF